MVSSRILSQSVGFSDMAAAYYTGKMSTAVLHSCRLERQGEYEFSPKNNKPHPPARNAEKVGQPIHFTVQPTTNDERPTTVWLLRSSAFGLQLVTGRSLRSRQPRCQNTEWRAGNIIEFHFVAELDRRRLSAVLTADPNFQVRASLAAAFGGDLHQLSDTFLIERVERVLLADSFSEVRR